MLCLANHSSLLSAAIACINKEQLLEQLPFRSQGIQDAFRSVPDKGRAG